MYVFKGNSLAHILKIKNKGSFLLMYKQSKNARETERITINIDSELLYKCKQICKSNGYELEQQLELILSNYVYRFELNHKPISMIDYRLKRQNEKKSDTDE